MKEFKDFTIEDFTSHTSMKNVNRPSGNMAHVSFFKSTTDRFRNINNPSSQMTEAILNVPTVTVNR